MATKANIVIDAGTTFSSDLTLKDENGDNMNLSGYTANAQMRKWYTSSNAIAFTASINTTSSTVTISLNAATTANLATGRYVYDVELTNTAANTISRIVEGIVTVTPNVTR